MDSPIDLSLATATAAAAATKPPTPPPPAHREPMPEQDQADPMLIWAPDVIENVSSLELDSYLRFSNSACVPGGGCSPEEALDVLYKCQGDIKAATKQLLKRETKETVMWTLDEVQQFQHLVEKFHKDFSQISSFFKTKSVQDCVRFYYLRKHQTNQYLNQRRQHRSHSQQLTARQQAGTQVKLESKVKVLSYQQQRQKQKLEQQLPIVKLVTQEFEPGQEIFKCKVCGAEFLKIKSRSAHMKRHKNERLYNLT